MFQAVEHARRDGAENAAADHLGDGGDGRRGEHGGHQQIFQAVMMESLPASVASTAD